MSRLRQLLLTVLGVLAVSGSAMAEQTEITVRVLSKDAKFVGSSMGGVQITLRDAETGEILASGFTSGSTGDTAKIIKDPRERGKAISDDKSAKYVAKLDLDRPRIIEVTASGPAAQRQSAMTVTSKQWVVPGKHIKGGDGWLLELPGFVVDVLNPPTHVKLEDVTSIGLKANVTMMCGCPIEPGGLWDADELEVAAILQHNGKPKGTVPLSFAGQTSQFAAEIDVSEAGVYEATVYAYDPRNGNTGLDRVTFIIQ